MIKLKSWFLKHGVVLFVAVAMTNLGLSFSQYPIKFLLIFTGFVVFLLLRDMELERRLTKHFDYVRNQELGRLAYKYATQNKEND